MKVLTWLVLHFPPPKTALIDPSTNWAYNGSFFSVLLLETNRRDLARNHRRFRIALLQSVHHVNFTRLIKHFQKNGIAVEATAFGWNVRNALTHKPIFCCPTTLHWKTKPFSNCSISPAFIPVHARVPFHPAPMLSMGCVVATDPDVVIPRAIGTDINCGMHLLKTDLHPRGQMGMHEKALQTAMGEGAAQQPPQRAPAYRRFPSVVQPRTAGILARLGQARRPARGRQQRAAGPGMGAACGPVGLGWACAARASVAPLPSMVGFVIRNWERQEAEITSLKSRRSRAHQQDPRMARGHQRRRRSRDHSQRFAGCWFIIGTQWMDRAKAQWPKGVAHPEHGLYALEGELATTYLQAMGCIALRLAQSLRYRRADAPSVEQNSGRSYYESGGRCAAQRDQSRTRQE